MYNSAAKTIFSNDSNNDSNIVVLRSKKITLQTIADKVGCSKNAVSLVLRERGQFSEGKRKTIKSLAKSLGYVPNYAARSLTLNRSGLVGVFFHVFSDPVRLEYIKCLLDILHDEHCKPILGLDDHHRGMWYDSSWVRTFEQINVDAIITICENFTEIPSSFQRIPIISVGGSPNANLICDSVCLDRREAGNKAAQHLIEKGHKKITVVVSAKHAFGNGAMECLSAHEGISFEHIAIDDSMERMINADITCLSDRVLSSRLRPSALIMGDALLAARLVKQLLANGVSIPGDIAVIAYDYLPNVDTCAMPLTLVEQPIKEIAIAAKELLSRRLEAPQAEYRQIVLPHRLVERASTANPDVSK